MQDGESVDEGFAERIPAMKLKKTLVSCDVGLPTGCASQSRKENIPSAAV